MLSYAGAITIAVLCAPVFAVYAGVSLDFALQLTALLALSASVSVAIPDITAQIALAVQLTAGIQLAVAIGLPSLAVSFGLALNAQLLVIEALVLAVEAQLALGGPSLQALTYAGPAAQLGPALTGELSAGWTDGTPANDNVTAVVFGAASSGTYPVGSLASLVLLGGGSNYERGLCSVSLTGNATATPTINPSTGAITGLTVGSHGSGYDLPPSVTISDTVEILGATNASPIVVTIPDTTDVTSVTIADAQGNTAVNGQWCAKVLTLTTIALYKDTGFTQPSSGNGAWVSGTGTVTGNGGGAAAVPSMGGGPLFAIQAFFNGLVFAPGLVNAGSISLAGICTLTFGLLLDLLDELNLEASLLGSATLDFGIVPPEVAGNLAIVGSIDASLNDLLEPPLLPSIQASLIAGISGRAEIILNLISSIGVQLGLAGEKLFVFTYSGDGASFGGALSSALASSWPDGTPSSGESSVVILAATSPAAELALSTFFRAAA